MANPPTAEDLENWTRAAFAKADNPGASFADLAQLLPIPDPSNPNEMKIPAATTVRNWIMSAEGRGILELKVVVPTDEWEGKRFTNVFKERIPNVKAHIVPNGEAKNLENLSQQAAKVLLDALCEINKESITIVLACGDTVRRTIHELFALLEQEPKQKETLATKKLIIIPASIHADYILSPTYPCAAVALFNVLAAEAFSIDMVKAFTPNLPQSFYEKCNTPKKIASYCDEYDLQPIINEAKKADIFVLGLGSTSGHGYQSILKSMEGALADPSRMQDGIAELLFVPLNDDGEPNQEISQRIVGIIPQDLRRALRDGRKVIGIFGGDKMDLVGCLVKSEPYMNVYVTDFSCSQKMIESKPTRVNY